MNKKTSNRGVSEAFTKAAAKKLPQPRKNTKKAINVEAENDNSSMEVGKYELLKPNCYDNSSMEVGDRNDNSQVLCVYLPIFLSHNIFRECC